MDFLLLCFSLAPCRIDTTPFRSWCCWCCRARFGSATNLAVVPTPLWTPHLRLVSSSGKFLHVLACLSFLRRGGDECATIENSKVRLALVPNRGECTVDDLKTFAVFICHVLRRNIISVIHQSRRGNYRPDFLVAWPTIFPSRAPEGRSQLRQITLLRRHLLGFRFGIPNDFFARILNLLISCLIRRFFPGWPIIAGRGTAVSVAKRRCP